MAIQIVPILKTLGPLVANASSVVANLKSTTRTTDRTDKVEALEREIVKAGELLAAVTDQLEALAREMDEQSRLNRSYERRTRWALGLAIASVAIAGILLAVFIF